jgi:hypothetical protein
MRSVARFRYLRSVGSNTSIYNDFARPLSVRSTQLINDVLEGILAALYPVAVAALDTVTHPEEVAIRLDDFQSAISSVKITGTIESETTVSAEAVEKSAQSLGIEGSKIPVANLLPHARRHPKQATQCAPRASEQRRFRSISVTSKLRWQGLSRCWGRQGCGC